jgi:hypothetical protein
VTMCIVRHRIFWNFFFFVFVWNSECPSPKSTMSHYSCVFLWPLKI